MADQTNTSSTSTPLPTPTIKQVLETAEAAGIVPEPKTTNMNTAAGQVDIPSVVGSQPSSNKPIVQQLQGVTIESLPLEDDFTRPLTEDEILRMPGLQARSFNFSGDEIKVLPITHNYVLRWVQCGDYKGAGTNWLARTIAKGFEYATEQDIQPQFVGKFKPDALGHLVIPPDLVLMKCDARLYYGYLKANMLESLDRVSDKGANERARAKAITDMAEPGKLESDKDGSRAAPGIKNFQNSLTRNKVSFYDPMAGR